MRQRAALLCPHGTRAALPRRSARAFLCQSSLLRHAPIYNIPQGLELDGEFRPLVMHHRSVGRHSIAPGRIRVPRARPEARGEGTIRLQVDAKSGPRDAVMGVAG